MYNRPYQDWTGEVRITLTEMDINHGSTRRCDHVTGIGPIIKELIDAEVSNRYVWPRAYQVSDRRAAPYHLLKKFAWSVDDQKDAKIFKSFIGTQIRLASSRSNLKRVATSRTDSHQFTCSDYFHYSTRIKYMQRACACWTYYMTAYMIQIRKQSLWK